MTEKEPIQQEPQAPAPEEPGYLTETGQAVGDDGSVVPIIGGLPAVEGSAWDIGAAADERGAGLAEEEEGRLPDRAPTATPDRLVASKKQNRARTDAFRSRH
jgi:hypothetical protein